MSGPEYRQAVVIFYATRDGQARRIAEHIFRRLPQGMTAGLPRDVGVAPPVPTELAAAAVIVLVAAVRYGRHLPQVGRFFAAYRMLPSPPPLALASVNLSARKPDKTTAAGNPYLRKLIARQGLKPALAVAFAGRLDYRRYRWWDRQIIRFIMTLTRGPTDPDTCVEYTSWSAVDEFAAGIAALARYS